VVEGEQWRVRLYRVGAGALDRVVGAMQGRGVNATKRQVGDGIASEVTQGKCTVWQAMCYSLLLRAERNG
jgi:hypothetical protein